jgi:hypothetical protein
MDAEAVLVRSRGRFDIKHRDGRRAAQGISWRYCQPVRLLDEYARRVNGDSAYVIAESLWYVFSRDREFAAEHGLAAPRRRRERAGAEE